MNLPSEEELIAKIEEYLAIEREYIPDPPLIPPIPPKFNSWGEVIAFRAMRDAVEVETERVRNLTNERYNRLVKVKRELLNLLPYNSVVYHIGKYQVSGCTWGYNDVKIYVEEDTCESKT